MRATEQSMIEARKRRVSTAPDGGNRRCERLFRRRVSAFPDGYAWAATKYAADCRLRAESCQTYARMGLPVMNSICSVHDFLYENRIEKGKNLQDRFAPGEAAAAEHNGNIWSRPPTKHGTNPAAKIVWFLFGFRKRRIIPCTEPSGPCCPPLSPSCWR